MKVLALILFCVSFQTQAMTVGKVNLQKALTSVKQGKSIQTYLKKEFKKKTKESQNRGDIDFETSKRF